MLLTVGGHHHLTDIALNRSVSSLEFTICPVSVYVFGQDSLLLSVGFSTATLLRVWITSPLYNAILTGARLGN